MLPALVAMHGSCAAVDRAYGLSTGHISQYLRAGSRTALKATCGSYAKPASEMCGPRHGYPSDASMIELMAATGSFAAVARRMGVRRGSLRDYLQRRHVLLLAMEAARPTPDSLEVRRARARARNAARQRELRASDPEGERRRRREQMRTYGSEYRRRWNHYNRARRAQVATGGPLAVEYQRILLADRCSYCDAASEHVDHIVAIATGGNEWENLTAACRLCNQSKQDESLLRFLLRRG